MSDNVFELDVVRGDLEAKYSKCIVRLSDGSDVELRAILRLRKEKRRIVKEKLEELNKLQEDGDDESLEHLDKLQELVEDILTAVADRYSDLLEELDGDIELEMMVLNRWLGETQVGEASSSPDSSMSTAGTSSPTSESDTESTPETSSAPTLFLAPASS